MKIMDKLKLKVDKKIFILSTILVLIGIVSGSIFVLLLNSDDKLLITQYLNNYINNINNFNLNYKQAFINGIIFEQLFNILIWLLGISVIGIPIIIFMFFSKAFSLGFIITSILNHYKFKGLIFAFLYIFPHKIINLFFLSILVIYSVNVSLKIINCCFKKSEINLKFIVKKYFMILILVSITMFIMSLYEIYLLPRIIKLILPIMQ